MALVVLTSLFWPRASISISRAREWLTSKTGVAAAIAVCAGFSLLTLCDERAERARFQRRNNTMRLCLDDDDVTSDITMVRELEKLCTWKTYTATVHTVGGQTLTLTMKRPLLRKLIASDLKAEIVDSEWMLPRECIRIVSLDECTGICLNDGDVLHGTNFQLIISLEWFALPFQNTGHTLDVITREIDTAVRSMLGVRLSCARTEAMGIMTSYLQDGDLWVRLSLVILLEGYQYWFKGDLDLQMALVGRIRDPNEEHTIRWWALRSLGDISASCDEHVISAVHPLLGDGDANIRVMAVHVLLQLMINRSCVTVHAIAALLGDVEARVQFAALRALGQIASTDDTEVIDALQIFYANSRNGVLKWAVAEVRHQIEQDDRRPLRVGVKNREYLLNHGEVVRALNVQGRHYFGLDHIMNGQEGNLVAWTDKPAEAFAVQDDQQIVFCISCEGSYLISR